MSTAIRQYDWSQGSWGWDRTGRYWRPPQYAGVEASVDILEDYEPSPIQAEVVLCDAHVMNCCASRRSGKTHTLGRAGGRRVTCDAGRVLDGEDHHTSVEQFEEWLYQTVGRPGGNPVELLSELLKKRHAPLTYWAVGPDRELSRLQARELSAIFERDYVRDVLGAKWFGNTLWIFALGARIDLKTGERPEKLVGDQLSGLWLGEAARLKPTVWENVRPCLDDRKGWIISDTTPRGRNWYYTTLWAMGDETVAKELGTPDVYSPDCQNFHWTQKDNYALPHLAEEYEKAKKRYGERSRHFIENYKATFDTPLGAVWPEFSRDVHLRRVEEVYFEYRVAAVDWGFSGSAGCMAFAGVLPDGSWHWYKSHYHTGLVVAPGDGVPVIESSTWAGFALREYARTRERFVVFADASRPDSITTCKQAGIDCRAADCSKGSVLDSCTTVEAMLIYDPDSKDPRSRRPLMTFDPDIDPQFLADIQGYEWAVDSTGKSIEVPSKNPDRHGADVCRYAPHSMRKQIRWNAIGTATLRR